ncbi:MAG TPA: hypothetical protein VMT56_01825 [Candidatus Bathyarchaeia archaeon]|nr:hypothetical protein [Candidatus Bathyarchaeia archaeon]
MKARIGIVLATMIVAFIVGEGLHRYSWTHIHTLIEVQVPFDYRVGSSHLSAEHYRIFHASSQLIIIQRHDGKANTWIRVLVSNTPPGKAASKLDFNQYGNQYFLSQVWRAKDNQRYDCLPSLSERALLAIQHRPGQVTVMGKP